MTTLRTFPMPGDAEEVKSGIEQYCEAYFEQRCIRVEQFTVEVDVDVESPLSSDQSSWLWERLNVLLVHACKTGVQIDEVEVELVEASGVFDIELYVSSQKTLSGTRTTWSREFSNSASARGGAVDCVPCPQGGMSWRARIAFAPQVRRVA
ncbi:MAG: hypothetical protein AB8B50_06835 [Pirellulaceae bacterium]